MGDARRRALPPDRRARLHGEGRPEADSGALRRGVSSPSARSAALAALPTPTSIFATARSTPDDAAYADIVDRVIRQEIGTGEGSNFVIKRTLTGGLDAYGDRVGLMIFRNLLRQERGAYSTFFIRMRDITFVGASPELHIKLAAKTVSAGADQPAPTGSPRSVRRRKASSSSCRTGKEEDELSMVLDEELKMMTDICDVRTSARTGPT